MNKGKKFYTSDTHFSHARIIDLCNRPFNSVGHMDAEIIRRWNEVVEPDDTVYHLGDVALGRIAESLPLLEQLNGHKILIPGNHDRVSSAYEDKRPAFRERFVEEYKKYFDDIMAETVLHYIDQQLVVMSHYPYRGDSQENDRHVDRRPLDQGLPLIHGHIHTSRDGVVKGKMFHVGVDVPEHNFAPVPESKIIAWLRTLS